MKKMKNLYKKILLFNLLFLTASFVFAQIRLPKLIKDGMVLQRDVPLKIWGWASPKEAINVTFNNASYKTSADKNGDWQIIIPKQQSGGPYVMTLTASNSITINDILVGDVWLCSGQSNMALPMYRVMDRYKDEIEQMNNPNIRLFGTPINYNFNESEKDLNEGGFWRAEWRPAIQKNAMFLSATSYFFAKELYDKYNVPIGIINASVGGTPIEAWISIETLKKYPEHVKEIEKCANKDYVENIMKSDRQNTIDRTKELDTHDKGFSKWHKADVDISDWDNISLPGYWQEQDVDLKYGVIWFRKEINVPESMTGKEGILRLGCIVDGDSTFINGIYVGNITYEYPPRIYPIKEGVLKKGKNVIAIRVVCDGKYGGFVEEKPYKIIVGDENIDITGEWKYKIGVKLTTPMQPTTTFYYKPVGLYNGMIAPMLNYSIKGVIWYQGESNTERADEYASLFPDFINDWRDKWNNPQLPFIYAQLPNFMKAQKMPIESDWAKVRNTQRKGLSLPNTGMAVTIDIGEWNDIHPLNKKELGRRLALEAQRVAYSESLVSQGPLYKSMEIKGNSIILTFTSDGSELYTNTLLKGFAIAGNDGKYVWANAVVIAKDRVKVWSPLVQNPVK
ncbi:MAG: hypothetical protein LBT27_06085, partial [Prevotellaceae bacterium]|nr:hypothetical protein [Prevotellaceae bacterium]